MFDRWVIAYDIDNIAAQNAEVTVPTIYNRIKAALDYYGFSKFTQLSLYAMLDKNEALMKVYQALEALSCLPERRYIKRLHVFRIDGALYDVLPWVADRSSFQKPEEIEK